jgi:hypothetical protein
MIINKYRKYTFLNWSLAFALFLSFLAWHGNFSSPLSTQEIDFYANELYKRNPEQSIEAYKKLLADDNGSPIYMVNIMKYFDDPVKTKDDNDGVDARKLVKTYNSYVGKFLIKHCSYPIFLGEASGGTAAAWGVNEEDSEGWSEAAIVRYKNIRTMMELATDEQFNKNLDYKHASLAKTIIYPTKSKLMPCQLEYLVFFIILSASLFFQLFINSRFKNRYRY